MSGQPRELPMHNDPGVPLANSSDVNISDTAESNKDTEQP